MMFSISPNDITVLPYGETRYWVAVASLGGIGVNGNFTVLSLEFNLTGLGTTSLDLGDTILGDSQGRLIAHIELDGNVRSFVHDVAVESIAPKSSVATQNSSVEIDVSVKNNGDYPENLTVSTYYNSTTSGLVNLIERQNLMSLLQNTRASMVFVWNITGVAEGFYQIFANVSIAENETSTINNQFTDGIVEVSGTALHDIAITILNANATTVTQGETVAITVAVKNQGWTDETNVNLTVYCDSNVLGEVKIPLIHPNITKEYVFYWNTTGIRANAYRLKAWVTVVPSDADATNNYCEDGTVGISPVIAEFSSVMLLAVFGIATVTVVAFVKKVSAKIVRRLG